MQVQQQGGGGRSSTAPMSSSYIGVAWHAGRCKWRAIIPLDDQGRVRSLGLYDSEIEAAKAYDRAAKKEFYNPVLNFLDDGTLNPDRNTQLMAAAEECQAAALRQQQAVMQHRALAAPALYPPRPPFAPPGSYTPSLSLALDTTHPPPPSSTTTPAAPTSSSPSASASSSFTTTTATGAAAATTTTAAMDHQPPILHPHALMMSAVQLAMPSGSGPMGSAVSGSGDVKLEDGGVTSSIETSTEPAEGRELNVTNKRSRSASSDVDGSFVAIPTANSDHTNSTGAEAGVTTALPPHTTPATHPHAYIHNLFMNGAYIPPQLQPPPPPHHHHPWPPSAPPPTTTPTHTYPLLTHFVPPSVIPVYLPPASKRRRAAGPHTRSPTHNPSSPSPSIHSMFAAHYRAAPISPTIDAASLMPSIPTTTTAAVNPHTSTTTHLPPPASTVMEPNDGSHEEAGEGVMGVIGDSAAVTDANSRNEQSVSGGVYGAAAGLAAGEGEGRNNVGNAAALGGGASAMDNNTHTHTPTAHAQGGMEVGGGMGLAEPMRVAVPDAASVGGIGANAAEATRADMGNPGAITSEVMMDDGGLAGAADHGVDVASTSYSGGGGGGEELRPSEVHGTLLGGGGGGGGGGGDADINVHTFGAGSSNSGGGVDVTVDGPPMFSMDLDEGHHCGMEGLDDGTQQRRRDGLRNDDDGSHLDL